MEEVDSNYCKNLLIKHDPESIDILKSLDIVKKYIIRNKLIIVGGMAIDFGLRLRKRKLYSDEEIPDYDFITPTHWVDAYEIAQWLCRIGIKNISVINAQHPTTMRVRVSGVPVADVTYVPKNIFELIPRLNYHGIDFVHPYYQYIDQHRSLSNGYENLELGRPVLINRWKKDMTRYDLLWDLYPIKWNGPIKNIELHKERVLPYSILENQCLNGFMALCFWENYAEKYGFKTTWNLGKIRFAKPDIIYQIPVDSHGITLYTNDIKETYAKILKKYKIKESRFYERFIDKIPRKIIIDNEWELIDNVNIWTAAHKHENYYVANLQSIMMYLLVNFIFLNKMKKEDRGYTFYAGYMMAKELIDFAIDNKIEKLLPTWEYYGDQIIGESYHISTLKIKQKLDKRILIPEQPLQLYDSDLKYKTIPKRYFNFTPSSEIFKMNGEQIDNFF